jgi:hypothetical protein
LESWFEIEFALLKVLKLQPSELERMEYYRVEYLLENLKNYNEERKKEEKKQEDNSAMSSPMSSAQSMFNTAQKGIPNLGSSMPSFNPGNFNLGNLKL